MMGFSFAAPGIRLTTAEQARFTLFLFEMCFQIAGAREHMAALLALILCLFMVFGDMVFIISVESPTLSTLFTSLLLMLIPIRL
jgi:hypothetical protein